MLIKIEKKIGERAIQKVTKTILHGLYIGLFVFLLLPFAKIEAKSASPALQGELAKAPLAKAAGALTDEYVQSEAHLQVDEVKEEMSKISLRLPGAPQPTRSLTPNQMVTPYLNVISAILNKEVELKNTHYAFYNASNNEWRVPQDLYKKLYVHYKRSGSPLNDFAFVRFGGAKSIKAQDFLNENIAKWGGVNDNIQEVKEVVMSVNLALFGNVGFPGECTWNYFMEAKSHTDPSPQRYYEIVKAFDVTYDIELLAKETKSLAAMLYNGSPEQTLYQFFVPQNKVDEVAYVAWVLGFPAHPKSIELMERVIGKKPHIGKFTVPAVQNVMKRFKNDKDNSIYQELIKLAADGEFGMSGFMEGMRNDPFSMKNLNETQGRLLVTNPMFKDPSSGVKVFTYFTTPKKIQDEYNRKFDALVQKIVSQEASKTPQQKAADRAKNEETYQRLEREAAAKAAAEAEKAKK